MAVFCVSAQYPFCRRYGGWTDIFAYVALRAVTSNDGMTSDWRIFLSVFWILFPDVLSMKCKALTALFTILHLNRLQRLNGNKKIVNKTAVHFYELRFLFGVLEIQIYIYLDSRCLYEYTGEHL